MYITSQAFWHAGADYTTDNYRIFFKLNHTGLDFNRVKTRSNEELFGALSNRSQLFLDTLLPNFEMIFASRSFTPSLSTPPHPKLVTSPTITLIIMIISLFSQYYIL